MMRIALLALICCMANSCSTFPKKPDMDNKMEQEKPMDTEEMMRDE